MESQRGIQQPDSSYMANRNREKYVEIQTVQWMKMKGENKREERNLTSKNSSVVKDWNSSLLNGFSSNSTPSSKLMKNLILSIKILTT